jgi:hypothetical protein
VQGLKEHAVKNIVEICFLTSFQHVIDPARVCTIADKNSAAAPLDLGPTLADQSFKGDTVAVRGQFNCTMHVPTTGYAALAGPQRRRMDLASLEYW